MRFSLWPSNTEPYAEILRAAQHAEATGWDGLWYADHFMPNEPGPFPLQAPVLEVGAVVAAWAASVPRVRIGTLVLGNTYRHPAVVANFASTVDRISEGRFVLGIGAGWQRNEHEQYGIPLPGVAERIDRFAEALQVVRSLLSEPRTTFDGTHYRLADALCEPKPVQDRLPIMIGASGEQRMLPLVAEHADQWNTWGLPALIANKSAVVDRHCERLGRDPGEILRTAQALLFVTDDVATADALVARQSRPAFGGPPDRIAEVVATYRAAGVDELIVPTGPLGTGTQLHDRMDLLMTEVFAQFR